MIQEKIKSLVYPLPEDVQLAKDAGDFEKENRLIDMYLNDEKTPSFLKDRFLVEKEIIRRLPNEYPYTESEQLKIIREEIPDFTMEELHEAMDSRKLDWIYVNKEVHIQKRAYASMKKVYKDIASRAHEPHQENVLLNDFMHELKEKGKLSYHIHLKTEIGLKDEYFHPGKVLVHLPIPTSCDSMQNIHILSYSESGKIDDEHSLSRTISFQEDMKENHSFYVEYEYDSIQEYHDVFSKESQPCDIDTYTEEMVPHIVFTPTVKALCKELSEGKKTDVEKAWSFYRYCTENVTYSFMRSYFTNTNIVEYALTHRIGDCGVKALLFITLCRCAGIPAHWQSGLYVNGKDVGNHDWAMFYIQPFGWVYAEPSFGGSAYLAGNLERQKFYFGNLDCYRMVANNEFQQELNPPKTCFRNDPYDNQSGEIEYCDEEGLLSNQFEIKREVIEFEKR